MTSDIYLTSAECAVLEALTNGEHEWVTPSEALRRIVNFKRAAYVRGLTALGFLDSTGGKG